MLKAFKYRLYPTRAQEQAMESLLETHRRLYNSALDGRKNAYQNQKRTATFAEQCLLLTVARREDERLAACSAASCQRTLRRLDRSVAAFFRRLKAGQKPGYPRFRGKGRFDSVEFTYGDGAKLTGDNKARFQGVGDVKVKLHRPVEGTIKTARFKREADGWHVIYSCDLPEGEAVEPSCAPAVGIDLGLKSFLVTSEGESITAPRLYRKAQKKLRRAQRSVARKKRGGKNRRKAVKRLARLHQHVANQRRDFHHKTAHDLVERYGRVAHEDLNVSGMVRSLNLGKSTHDAGWSGFLSILSHKAACAGVEVVGVDPRQTSQMCSRCGSLPETPLGLRDRVYRCLHCGLCVDRDFNAALNIRNRAFFPEPNRARIEPLGVNQEGCLMDFPRSPQL